MTVCSNGYPSEYIFGDITMSTSVLGDRGWVCFQIRNTRGQKKSGKQKKKGKKKIRPYISCTRVRVFDFLPSDSKFKMPYCIFREAFNNISISRGFQQWNCVRSWYRDYNS